MMQPKKMTWVRGPFAGKDLIAYCYHMQAGDPLAKLEIEIQSAGLNTVVSVIGPDWFVDAMNDFVVAKRL